MSLVTLDGADVSALELSIPSRGFWWAGVTMTGTVATVEVGAQVVLDLAGRRLAGTVVAGGAEDGRVAYRIIAGRGGWRRTIPRRPYANDFGIKAVTVTQDAAQAVGEVFAPAGAGHILGPHFVRAEAPASHLLSSVWGEIGWYLDDDGVTHPGARAASSYAGRGTVATTDPASRRVTIHSDTVEGLIPGVRVEGRDPACDVEISLEAGRFSTTLHLGPPGLSRRLSAIKRIMDRLDPWRRYAACYEYRVVVQTGDRFDLQCVRSATKMPDLPRVPIRPGMAGLRATVTPGERVLVAFIDGDPSRPAIVSHEEPDSPGWMPLSLELGGPAALGVARVTDPVIAGPFAGTVVSGSLRVKASL